MNRTIIDRGWTIERREAVGFRYQRIMAGKTRKAEYRAARAYLAMRRAAMREAA